MNGSIQLLVAFIFCMMQSTNVASGTINNPSGESFKQRFALRQDKGLAPRYSEEGDASWYGEKFHGGRMRYGGVFDMNKVSFAHNTLPADTVIKVTNLKNGRSVVGPVKDTGSFDKKYDRIVDCSREAMRRIGGLDDGVVPVRIEVVRYASAM